VKDVLLSPGPMPGWASYSAVGTHRSCPQRWNYAYLMRLERAPDASDAKVELNFGIWWHALRAAAAIERGRELGTLRLWPRTIEVPGGVIDVNEGSPSTLAQRVLIAARTWYGALPEEHKAQWIERLGDTTLGRLEDLDRRWHHRWAADHENEEPLGVEVKWTRALPDGTEMIGYIDYVYRDRKRGIAVVRDYKSMKDLPSQSAKDDMMNSQLHLYVWGAAQALAAAGIRLAAVSYDRARSVRPTTPKLNQSGTLSKTVTLFDELSYLDWVAEGQKYPGRAKDGSQAGVYEAEEALLEHLRNPAWVSKWFQRTLVPLNANLIRGHVRAAVDAVEDMRRSQERAERTGEAPRSLGDSCRWCDFAELCRAQLVGGPRGEYDPRDFGLVQKG